ncbi:hypothetical protein BDV59DRAFT_54827 [Aspergillus ambiguus]|uniref:uncharacterized protein n=1 Tax=Aspergillus ambiguus TaxID=176160 RepID=UPI003CCDAEBC
MDSHHGHFQSTSTSSRLPTSNIDDIDDSLTVFSLPSLFRIPINSPLVSRESNQLQYEPRILSPSLTQSGRSDPWSSPSRPASDVVALLSLPTLVSILMSTRSTAGIHECLRRHLKERRQEQPGSVDCPGLFSVDLVSPPLSQLHLRHRKLSDTINKGSIQITILRVYTPIAPKPSYGILSLPLVVEHASCRMHISGPSPITDPLPAPDLPGAWSCHSADSTKESS